MLNGVKRGTPRDTRVRKRPSRFANRSRWTIVQRLTKASGHPQETHQRARKAPFSWRDTQWFSTYLCIAAERSGPPDLPEV